MLRVAVLACALLSADASVRPAMSPALKLRGGAGPLVSAPKAPTALTDLKGGQLGGVDWQLLFYFAAWYLGNYYYTLNNKLALKAAGGASGFPVSIAFFQMLLGSLYALYVWIMPDLRETPNVTLDDVKNIVPVAACAAGAHIMSIFSMNLGAVSFAQIVKASEPAFAAVLGVTLYGKTVSTAKWLCLIPVIGGVCLASIKELDFSVAALGAACLANLFAAFRSNENKKLMETEGAPPRNSAEFCAILLTPSPSSPGLSDRIGSTGNQFALTTLLGTACLLPFFLGLEASRFGQFVELFKTVPAVRNNLLTSGLYFYLYNEMSTLTIKKTNAVTQSVANTAKRVIVIVGVAIALGESLDPIKMLGCSIGIAGVMAYSLVK